MTQRSTNGNLLHRDAFTHNNFWRGEVFTQRFFLHWENSPKALQCDYRSQLQKTLVSRRSCSRLTQPPQFYLQRLRCKRTSSTWKLNCSDSPPTPPHRLCEDRCRRGVSKVAGVLTVMSSLELVLESLYFSILAGQVCQLKASSATEPQARGTSSNSWATMCQHQIQAKLRAPSL